jgi:predicted secreted hydrolase
MKTKPGALRVALVIMMLALAGCAFPGVVSTTQQLPKLSEVEQPLKLPPVRFPQDEAAHNDLTEWWYYTGHLQATDSSGQVRHYGFELVIFQALRSNYAPVYAAHFAISDITRGEFRYDQRSQVEPHAVIPNGTSTQGINVHVGDWSIRGLNGEDHLAATMKDYAIELELSARKPPVLHNGKGIITYGLAGFSYYYSRTRMAVSGSIVDHGQTLQVSGLAWMDHQWGNFLILSGGGWDWYSLQLDNDTELMIYFVRDATGRVISTYVSYIDAGAKDHLLSAQAIRATVLDHWTSPATRITYPSGWRFDIADPQLRATLTLTPLLKNQELVTYSSTGNAYWEGAVSIQGQSDGRPIAGEGYVELTGYSAR